GVMVGDQDSSGQGGYGSGLNLPPSPGSPASQLQLLSDPLGVDFKPYLIRVLASVKQHWLAVIPESVRMGRRGKVAIQFSIARDGNVPKLVIAAPSGADALDRAAVAGISASVPFPPLPTEFKGDRIVLQFNFAYNSAK
ncbi:MAG: TonB C-terminal domain-containing protein, partial [Acidobacteriia bacterium]|nr:TonB C-terminal domain-containing protein [Terriglobia bacterium]